MKLKNQCLREFIAETFGTFILVIFVCGACAQNTFLSTEDKQFNSNLSVHLACGFAVTIAGKNSYNLKRYFKSSQFILIKCSNYCWQSVRSSY
jgi:hypothetical protein